MTDPSVSQPAGDGLTDNRGRWYRAVDLPKLPLDSCHAKLERASQHLQALHQELADFFDSNPYTVTGQVEDNSSWYVFRLEPIREPPLGAAVVLGELIHQVRSTLDHLIFALAWNHLGRKPPNTVNFPITTSKARFPRQACGKLFDSRAGAWVLPDICLALVEGLQPYNRGDTCEQDDLTIIERLWNLDKHQSLTPILVTETVTQGATRFASVKDVSHVGGTRGYAGTMLEAGAQIARVHITASGPNPKVRMESVTFVRVASEGIYALLPALGSALLRVVVLVHMFSSRPAFALPPLVGSRSYPTTIIGP